MWLSAPNLSSMHPCPLHVLQVDQLVHVGQGVDAARASSQDYGPLLLLDTAGCDMEEAQEEGIDSRLNDGEARVALAHAARLMELGVPAPRIGIITPYSAQVPAAEAAVLIAAVRAILTLPASLRRVRVQLSTMFRMCQSIWPG